MSTIGKDPLIIECAWEVCNQVGGIYTVIRSKVPAAVARRGENYCLLGPLENENISAEFDPINNLSDPIGRTVEKMRNMGYEVWYGTWLVTGRPKVVLLNQLTFEWSSFFRLSIRIQQSKQLRQPEPGSHLCD